MPMIVNPIIITQIVVNTAEIRRIRVEPFGIRIPQGSVGLLVVWIASILSGSSMAQRSFLGLLCYISEPECVWKRNSRLTKRPV